MFDNLHDARQKLDGTYCYYQNRAVYIREIRSARQPKQKDLNWELAQAHLVFNGQVAPPVPVQPAPAAPADPAAMIFVGYYCSDREGVQGPIEELSWRDFKIGYVGDVWAQRRPLRQFKQGLTAEQLTFVSSKWRSTLYTFGGGEDMSTMLEGTYLSFEQAVAKVRRAKQFITVPFHRNFLVYNDPVRDELILEYKARPVGVFECNNSRIRLLQNYEHVMEQFQEVIEEQAA